MKETIELGSSPCDEDCAQVGTEGYEHRALSECGAFINQLHRAYVAAHQREFPKGLTLKTKANTHEFGRYYEVVVTFKDDDREAIDAAYWLEGNAPQRWDDIARQELAHESR